MRRDIKTFEMRNFHKEFKRDKTGLNKIIWKFNLPLLLLSLKTLILFIK